MPKIQNKTKKSRKVDHDDPLYKEKREKNNEAIKRTRAKAKAKQEETLKRITDLKTENNGLEQKIENLASQMSTMKEILRAHYEREMLVQVDENLNANRKQLIELLADIQFLNCE